MTDQTTETAARERVQIMIRTNQGNMTVWSEPEVRDALDAYRDAVHAAASAVSLPPADQTALRDRTAAALYAHDHPSHTVPLNETGMEAAYRETADAVLAVLPATPGRAALVRACASFVRDTYSGEWADDAAATLETDADRIERGEPCSLLRLAAVLPATTNHDTDSGVTPPPALTEEGRLRARVQVLEEDAERDQGLAATGARCLLRGHQGQIESGSAVIEGHRFALSTKLGLGTGAPWGAIHERVAELRRVADETAATETQAHAPLNEWRVEILDADEWMPASRLHRDRDQAADQFRMASERRPLWNDGTKVQRRLVRETTTYTVEQPAAGARQDGAPS